MCDWVQQPNSIEHYPVDCIQLFCEKNLLDQGCTTVYVVSKHEKHMFWSNFNLKKLDWFIDFQHQLYRKIKSSDVSNVWFSSIVQQSFLSEIIIFDSIAELNCLYSFNQNKCTATATNLKAFTNITSSVNICFYRMPHCKSYHFKNM